MKPNDQRLNEMDDDAIEGMLGDFLHQKLDGQTGRALRAFAARDDRALSAPPARRRASSTRRLLIWALPAAGAIAAAVAVAMALPIWRQPLTPNPMSKPIAIKVAPIDLRPRPAPAPGQSPANPPATADAYPFSPPPGANFTEAVNIHDIDDGVMLVNGQAPMRQLRRQTLQCITWFDPRYQANVEMLVPREQLVLVAVNPF